MNIKNKMTKVAIGMTALGLILTGCGANKDVAAKVNGIEIPMKSYVNEYKSTATQVMTNYGEEFLNQPSQADPNKKMSEAVRENVLNNLVQMEILRQDAEKSKITVSDEDIDKYIDQTKQMYGEEEAFNKALEEQGISLEYYKEYIKRGLLMQKYHQEKVKEIEPKDEELKEYYEKNKEKFQTVSAAHILVKTEDEAKQIKAELDSGADFAELAKTKSQDPGSGQQGGDLGSFTKGQMVKEFEDKAFSMKEGEISEPVKTQFGYHIIKLNKMQNDFESQKETIKAQLVQEKFTNYVKKLEGEAKVEKFADPKKDIKVEPPKQPEAAPAAEGQDATEKVEAKKNDAKNSTEKVESNAAKTQENNKAE